MHFLAIPAIAIVLFFLFIFFSINDPVPALGIYSRPGKWYWVKFYIMKYVIILRQFRSGRSKKSENLMNSQFGGDGGARNIEEMEKKHKLEGEWAADAVFFDASNREGWYFTLGTAQRQNDIINLFFILRIPNVGIFVNEEMLTNTNVKSINTCDSTWQTESGFVIKCIEPMKKWSIKFNGKLTKSPGSINFSRNGPETLPVPVKTINASFDLIWTNFGEQFDFDKSVSPVSIAHSLAIEPWSRKLFDKLRSSHQTHYEQFGHINGTFDILDMRYTTRMTSMRDHTIAAHRRWTDIRRYIMMIYHLADGTCIHTSVISMPGMVFTQLEFGYMVLPNGKTKPIDRVYLSLVHHGEDKGFPTDFGYAFLVGTRMYHVDVRIIDGVSFKMGLDLACQVNEGMAEFKVDGERTGYGFVELEYRIKPY